MVFENTSKMLAFSSASYTFENLYKTYNEWTEKIINKENVLTSNQGYYFGKTKLIHFICKTNCALVLILYVFKKYDVQNFL